MKVKTKVTFNEYVKLLYGLAYEKPILRLLIMAAFVLLTWIFFYYLNLFHLPKPIIYQYASLILIVIVQPFVIFISIRKNYFSSNHLRETLEMEMTPKEMKITGESFYTELKWDKIFKIVEKKNWFLIYQNNFSAILIPKNDLQKNEINEFKEILKGIKNVPIHLIES